MNIQATIYKMNLPFGEGSLYDKTKYYTIIDELEKFLKYDGTYQSTDKETSGEYELRTLHYTGGRIVCIFFFEKNHYFLPSFQIDLYSPGEVSTSFLKDFCRVFSGVSSEEYICDFIDGMTPVGNLLTENILSKDFLQFDIKKLELLLKDIDKYYIEERLAQEPKVRNHLYYLVYLNYRLFKNILLSKGGVIKLEEFLGEDIDDSLKTHLSLSKERIYHVSEVNIEVFKKYKQMLEGLFSLLDK